MSNNEVIEWKDIPHLPIIQLNNKKELWNKNTNCYYKLKHGNCAEIRYNTKVYYINVDTYYNLLFNNSSIGWKDLLEHSFLQMNDKRDLKNKTSCKIYPYDKNKPYIDMTYNKKNYRINNDVIYYQLFEQDLWKYVEIHTDFLINEKGEIRHKDRCSLIKDKDSNGYIALNEDNKTNYSNRWYLYEKTWLSKEKWKYYKEIEELKIKYPDLANQFEDAYTLYPHYRDDLLIIKTPELIDELYTENNISIGLIMHNSGEECFWTCEDHKNYTLSPKLRTYEGNYCPICEKEDLDKKEILRQSSILENWVEQELINKGLNAEAQNDNNKVADIIVMMNEKMYSIQCKTLTFKGKRISVSIGQNKDYPDNLLIVAINNDKDKFTYFFGKDIKGKNKLRLTASKERIINNKENFINEIINLISQSFIIENIVDHLTENGKKEYLMKQRLKSKCKELNLIYRKHKNNIDTIDCFINNIPCQLKYSSRKNYNQYDLSCCKSGGEKLIPYSIDDDFKIYIGEIAEYQNQFFIIAKEDLIKYGYIQTNEQEGKVCICIPIPNNKDHRFHYCWNNYDLLR